MSHAISVTVLILEEEEEIFGDNPWGSRANSGEPGRAGEIRSVR
jgi:hypothetical protein